jgi:hypothetical protein
MKTTLLFSSFLIIGGASLHALVNLGEGEIDFSATASVNYDTRITARNTELEDTVLRFSPTLVYMRPFKQADFSASVGVQFLEYLDNSEFSDENFFFDLSISPKTEIQTSRLRLTGDLSINTTTQSNEDTGTIITTRNYGVGGTLTYDPNRHYTLVLNASAAREDPEDSAFREIDRYGAGVRVLVPVKQDIMGNLGVNYQNIESDEELDSAGEVVTVLGGFSGLLLPKLEGYLLGGINFRQNDTTGDEESPYLSASLVWAADDLTQVTLSGSSTVDSTINDFSTESTSLSLSVTRDLSREWSASGSIGYSDIQYTSSFAPDRNDEQAYISLGINHRISRWGTVSATFRYSDRTSDTAEFDYDRLQLGLSLNGRW